MFRRDDEVAKEKTFILENKEMKLSEGKRRKQLPSDIYFVHMLFVITQRHWRFGQLDISLLNIL
jgi:hypothetical protein